MIRNIWIAKDDLIAKRETLQGLTILISSNLLPEPCDVFVARFLEHFDHMSGIIVGQRTDNQVKMLTPLRFTGVALRRIHCPMI